MKKAYSFKIIGGKKNMRKDGSFPVCLVVRKQDARKIIFTGISANPEQWNEQFELFEVDKRVKNLHSDREKNNTWLNEKKDLCDEILKEYDKKRIDWTLNQFEQEFLNRSKHEGVEKYFNKLITKLTKAGNIGNKNCYERTLYMLNLFDPKFCRLVFSDIDLKYIKRFDEYLRIDRGCANNTIKYYMRAFRALINKAIEDGEASKANYPFGKYGYSVAALGTETEKRYLPSEYIETLKTATIESPTLQWVRNLFMFSYYCQGMAIFDVATLTNRNIMALEGGKYICYRRRKTEGKKSKIIRIKITDKIQSLLDWFKKNTKLVDDYIAPVITIEGYEGEQLYNHIRDRYKKYNRHLKKLGEDLKFEGIRLSSYMSRHSYAMRLKNSGIPEDVISEALGHKDLSTTKTYLDSFQKDEIAKANEVL